MKILISPYLKEENKYLQIAQAYTNALIERGGLPVLVPITEDESVLDRYLDGAKGIVISGGVDVEPTLYGEPKKDTCFYTDTLQDKTSLYLIEKAIEMKIPIFGICRGIQIINTYFGGTLYQDIKTEYKDALEHNPGLKDGQIAHDVVVEKNSLLYSILGQETVPVNSVHHQAIKTLGKGLNISAHATDGIIEGIEGPHNIFAVQWHPEQVYKGHSVHAKLFDYFMSLVNNA